MGTTMGLTSIRNCLRSFLIQKFLSHKADDVPDGASGNMGLARLIQHLVLTSFISRLP